MSSSFGENIRFSLFGQSHGQAIGVVIDNLPAGEAVDEEKLRAFMARRAGGKAGTTARREDDIPVFLSGLIHGKTCGAPLCAVIENKNMRSEDYAPICEVPRPSHADFTAHIKYGGHNDVRGGGHFSGRLTAALCVAGGICRQILERRGVFVGAHIASVAGICDEGFDPVAVTVPELLSPGEKAFPVICDKAGEEMQAAILAAQRESDSVGGVVEGCALGLPAGVGSPMFGGVENRLAAAIFGIPAVRGVEFGTGFAAAALRGSQHNDAFVVENGQVRTATNHHGGVLGGISSGMPVVVRAAFKPTPSIEKPQQSVRLSGLSPETLSVGGRHDPCIVSRAVPCVEAAMAAVLCDMLIFNS
jgi:chorismate synthase